MTRATRRLPVRKGEVACLPGEPVTLDRCRFCVHSKAFRVRGAWVTAPARAFCVLSGPAEKEVDLRIVEEVECDDVSGEGYRSMLNVIS